MRQYSIIAGALAVLAGCTFDYEQCAPDECESGQVCVIGQDSVPRCLTPDVPMPEPDAGDAVITDTPSDEDAPDTEPDPDMTTEPPACPAFEGCGEEEPNDDLAQAIWLNDSALGCSTFDLENWRKVRQDAACGGDEDVYLIDYVPCEETAFKLTITLETQEQCGGAVLELVDGPYRCDQDNVRCTTTDTTEEIVVIVEPTSNPSPSENVYFAVRPLDPDAGIEYVLKTTVGR